MRIMGANQSSLSQSVGGGAGAGFLSEAEVDAADDLSLLVEIFERGFHLAVQEHEAVDLDALLLAQIFRVADGWNWSAEIARNFVDDFSALANLADGEIRFFEAIVGNGVRALIGSRSFGPRGVCFAFWP